MVTRRTLARIVYIIVPGILFYIGAFIVPNLSTLKEIFGPSESYSLISGLSLATWFSLPALLIDWLKPKSANTAIIKKKFVIAFTISLLAFSIALYPPITTLLLSWEKYNSNRTWFGIIMSALTALSSYVVYILGQNGTSKIQNSTRDGVIKFLLTVVTLISLTSIAISFVLSNASYSNAMSTSYQRAIILSSYCLLPLAAYGLGYLSKLINLRVATGLGVFLSFILGFFMGTIVNPIITWNSFFFSVNIPLFLIIGLILALYENGSLF